MKSTNFQSLPVPDGRDLHIPEGFKFLATAQSPQKEFEAVLVKPPSFTTQACDADGKLVKLKDGQPAKPDEKWTHTKVLFKRFVFEETYQDFDSSCWVKNEQPLYNMWQIFHMKVRLDGMDYTGVHGKGKVYLIIPKESLPTKLAINMTYRSLNNWFYYSDCTVEATWTPQTSLCSIL
jgi:hypothetical protein